MHVEHLKIWIDDVYSLEKLREITVRFLISEFFMKYESKKMKKMTENL
jgi:hypothetical protein